MNGQSYIPQHGAKSLAHYPHMRRVGGFLFVSGTSSRNFDDSIEGAIALPDGSVSLDIRKQTRAVIENIKIILQQVDADLQHIVDITTFLVEMADYSGYNEVYNSYFDIETGPTRTTIAAHQLPHPHLLIEMKIIAIDPLVKSST